MEKELHQLVLKMLRVGMTPTQIAELMQREKAALLQTTEYIDAINESFKKP